RRAALQLPGRAPFQGEVRPRLGAAVPRLARRRGAAAHPRQPLRAHRRRLEGRGRPMKTPQRLLTAGLAGAAAVAAFALLALAAAARADETTMDVGRFGTVHLY